MHIAFHLFFSLSLPFFLSLHMTSLSNQSGCRSVVQLSVYLLCRDVTYDLNVSQYCH